MRRMRLFLRLRLAAQRRADHAHGRQVRTAALLDVQHLEIAVRGPHGPEQRLDHPALPVNGRDPVCVGERCYGTRELSLSRRGPRACQFADRRRWSDERAAYAGRYRSCRAGWTCPGLQARGRRPLAPGRGAASLDQFRQGHTLVVQEPFKPSRPPGSDRGRAIERCHATRRPTAQQKHPFRRHSSQTARDTPSRTTPRIVLTIVDSKIQPRRNPHHGGHMCIK